MGKETGEVPPGPQTQGQQPGARNAQGGTPNASGPAGGATGGAKHKDTKVPPPPQHQPPTQILQLTPELFQQTVAAAVTAALNAAQQPAAARGAIAAAVVPNDSAQVVPRKEKKLAEFWTSRPTMWFRLFDGHFPVSMTEDARFNALLNHLPAAALPFVDHILRAPGQNPFTRA